METARRRRAAPLSPEDRRAALVDAVVPLLRAYGRDVTTRQIAEAAGVAEGTIFRAFPDKGSLIDAAVEQAFDMTDVHQRLAAIDTTLSLDDRVHVVVRILRRRLELWYGVLVAVRPPLPDPKVAATRRRAAEQVERTERVIADLLAPNAGGLHVDPAEAARWLRLSVVSATHPILTGGKPLPTERIVALVLGGIAGGERGAARC